MSVEQEKLMKALSEMEDIAKGDASTGKGNKIPKTTQQANGGLSKEGDQQELAVKGEGEEDEEVDADFESLIDDDEGVAKGGKKKGKKTLSQWAKDEEKEHAKALDGEDDDDFVKGDDDEDDEDDEDLDTKKSKKSAKKSLSGDSIADLVKSSAGGGPVVDVSPFIEALVDQVSDADMEVRKAIVDMESQQSAFNDGFRKALVAMGNLTIGINKKLDSILDLPAGERTSVLNKSEINERFEEAPPDFSKTQVLDAMCELAEARKITPIDVSRYETTNTMEENVMKAVNDHLLAKSA